MYKRKKIKGIPFLEHRVIMENHLGRKLDRREVVHISGMSACIGCDNSRTLVRIQPTLFRLENCMSNQEFSIRFKIEAGLFIRGTVRRLIKDLAFKYDVKLEMEESKGFLISYFRIRISKIKYPEHMHLFKDLYSIKESLS
jgi:hypothetical protein